MVYKFKKSFYHKYRTISYNRNLRVLSSKYLKLQLSLLPCRVGFWTKTQEYPDLSLDRPEEANKNNTIFYGDKEFARLQLHASSNHYVI